MKSLLSKNTFGLQNKINSVVPFIFYRNSDGQLKKYPHQKFIRNKTKQLTCHLGLDGDEARGHKQNQYSYSYSEVKWCK